MTPNQAICLTALFLIIAANSAVAQTTAGSSVCPFGYINITASSSSHSSSSSSVVVSGGSAVVVTSANASSSSSVTVTVTAPVECQPAVPCDCPIDQECVAYEPKYCITTPCPQWSCRSTNCTGGQVFNRTTLSCECPSGYDFNTTSNSCVLPNSTICLPDTCNGTDVCYEIVQECDTCPQFRCCPTFTHWNQTLKDCVSDDSCAASPCPENAICSNCANCTEGFRCTCLPGYQSNGTACLPKNPCNPNPCPDHAYCHAVNQTIAQCRCDNAYQPSANGTQCVLRNPCEPNPCPSNSFCAMLTPFRARCICDCGYTLSANKTQCLFNPCFPNRCKCGKQCVANGTDYSCVNPVCPLGTQYSETACGCANFTCPLGWHFETALKICVPNDFPCAGAPCPSGQVCQYRPQTCPCSPPTCTVITGSAKASSSCTASATVVVPWGSVSSTSSATANASSTYTAYQCSTPSCKCPQYQCVPAGAPSCPAGQTFDSFTGACVSTQPISVNVSQGCVFCAAVVPRCNPVCAADEDCQITNQDCFNCATARCVKKVVQNVGCVSCPAQVPVCPFCPIGKSCKVTQQTCNQCATATCV